MRIFTGVVLAAAVLAGACSSAPSADDAAVRGAEAPLVGVESEQPPAPAGQAGPPGQPGQPGATSPRKASTQQPGASPPAAQAPSLGGSPEASSPPAGQDETQDVFDRRAHLPPGAVRVVGGRNAQAEWRLYAYKDDGRTCLHFASQSAANGGAGGTCDQRPPLDRSVSESSRGRFGWGLVSARVVKVRFEHGGGAAETFDAVGSPGFAEKFYAGELAATPITRIVALDGNGKVVAERTDSTTLNM